MSKYRAIYLRVDYFERFYGEINNKIVQVSNWNDEIAIEFDTFAELARELDERYRLFDGDYDSRYCNIDDGWLSVDIPLSVMSDDGAFLLATDDEIRAWERGEISGFIGKITIGIEYADTSIIGKELARDMVCDY